jgi:hypothetical protein
MVVTLWSLQRSVLRRSLISPSFPFGASRRAALKRAVGRTPQPGQIWAPMVSAHTYWRERGEGFDPQGEDARPKKRLDDAEKVKRNDDDDRDA